MRLPIDNPFTPGADAVPRVWAGRDAQLADWSNVLRPRRHAGLPERGRTILGEAGLGKSSLVARIREMAEETGDWVTEQMRIPVGTDPLSRVAREVLDLASRAGLASKRESRINDLLRRVESIAVHGASISLRAGNVGEAYNALTDLLKEVGTAAMHADRVVVLHVDEVQNITDSAALSQLLIAFGDAMDHQVSVEAPGGRQVRRRLPIIVYLTGLPEFEDMAGAKTGATFARRFQMTKLAAIDDKDMTLALEPFITDGWEVMNEHGGTGRVFMEQDAADLIVHVSRGEPFLFQLAGEKAWYAGTSDTITTDDVLSGWELAVEEARAHVERLLSRIPERERAFLDAMAALDPADRTLTRIATKAGFSSAAAAGPSSLRLDTVRGIISRGKPYEFKHRAVEAYLTTNWPDSPQG